MLKVSQINTTAILNGKCFITTRPYGKSVDLADMLSEYGAELLELPMIELSEVECDEEECELLNTYKNYSHIAFTSAYGFQFFYDKMSRQGFFKDMIGALKIVSIGYKTTELINSYGLPIEFDAKAKTGSEFADRFVAYLDGKNAKVIWATGTLSPHKLTKRLGEVAEVIRVNLYKNSMPDKVDSQLVEKIKRNDYDMIILASPSAFNNLNAMLESNELKTVCIGHTTADAVKKQGIIPLSIANEPTSEGIFQAILSYYRDKV